MKSLSCIAIAGLALATTPALIPQPAEAAANDDVPLCRVLVDAQVYSSLGECVGSVRSNPAKFCRDLDDQGFLVFFGWKNRGDCVSSVRELN
jgi:hypothetical protein